MNSFESELGRLIADWLEKGANPHSMLLTMDDGKGILRDHIKLAEALGHRSPEAGGE